MADIAEINRVMTTGEVAKYCGVSFRTVIRWIERGHLNAYKLPGRGDNRVQMADFMLFLKQNKMPVPDELKHIEAVGVAAKRVLIVEDDDIMACAIEFLLEQAGYETKIAVDGFQAGAMLGTFKPDVMTLDMMLPGMSGVEVLTFIRGMSEFNELGILVVSGSVRDEHDRYMAAGASDVLAKPFENITLVDKVESLLAKR
ncbi:MAG: response regulator [Thiotrichaceae bacterium]|nr:response regulator [Thiotrichaceae bacterium]PCI14717.1 MAG: response regulator [Thiotrichales bacterium]